MSKEASLASVVSLPMPHFVEKWVKLDDHDPLVQLHSKFWGTSVQKEEAWGTKETLTSAPGDDKANQKPGMSAGGSEDDDGEILPGCHFLDINNDAIDIKRIWVRAEYIRIYDYLVEFYNKKTARNGRSPSAIITGQSGIGKTTWLYYALYRCLADRRPVILRHCDGSFLFVEDGVYLMRDYFQLVQFKTVTWTLVVDNPDDFIAHNTDFFVIHTMPLVEKRWSRFKSTTINTVIIMNPWSRGEIHRVAPNTLDSRLINDIYDRFGPTLKPLKKLTPNGIQELAYELRNLKMDTNSQKVFLVKRLNFGDVWSIPYLTHITDHIRSRVAVQLRNFDSLQKVDFYRSSTGFHCRGTVEHVLESFCQQIFQRRILIDFVPMVWFTGLDGQRKCQLNASRHPGEDQLEKSRQNALRPVTLDIYPSDVCEYNEHDTQDLAPKPDVYYIPSTQNAVAVESFIYHGGYVYFFHFPVSDEYNIMSRFTQCANFPPQSKWRLIFIVPDDVEVLTSPYSRSLELQTLELNLFSSKIKIQDYMKVVFSNEQEEPPHKKQKRTAEVSVVET